MLTDRRCTTALLALTIAVGAAACGDEADNDTTLPPVVQCAVTADCTSPSGLAAECVTIACDAGRCIIDAVSQNDTSCDDGDGCTTGDRCSGGLCEGSDPECDDANGCTVDAHHPTTCDCQHVPVAAQRPCDDDRACTTDDRCDGQGSCVGLAGVGCECQTDAECVDQPIADPCFSGLICAAFRCVPNPATKLICDPSANTECTHNICDSVTGECALRPRNEGAACDVPADRCADVDPRCVDGTCAGGAKDCDDAVACTTDSCDLGVCENTPGGAACDDGDPCTVPAGDGCDADGSCVYGPNPCDDKNVCTADSCDPAAGGCQHAPVDGACDDGDPCTADDTCTDGACVGSEAAACDDANPCTVDFCQVVGVGAGTPVCGHAEELDGAPCDDGDACTVDDECASGQCAGALACECKVDSDCAAHEDGNPCTGTLICDTSQADPACVIDPATVPSCPDDGTVLCFVNRCVPEDGVCALLPAPEGVPCEDDEPCTTESLCLDGACVPSALLECDDLDDCTADLCQAGSCSSIDLDDAATFLSEGFAAGMPAEWSATSDNPAVGWGVEAVAGGMALVATGNDGSLDHGAARAVLRLPEIQIYGDKISLSYRLTTDFAETGSFDDFVAVAVSVFGGPPEVVASSRITASLPEAEVVVDLSSYRNRRVALSFVLVTDEDANAASGVTIDDVLLAAHFSCDDGEPCSVGGRCSQGACLAGEVDCSDGNLCTYDTCEVDGCQHAPLWICQCELDSDCDGGNPCVLDTCEAGACQEQLLAGECDDGSVCTQGDHCVQSFCTGDVLDCDDDDECTLDGCHPVDGCTHEFAALPCDDDDACTQQDTCHQGTCAGTPIDCGTTACAVGTCVDGGCFYDVFHDGQSESDEDFDGVVPGATPPGWQISATDIAWAWAASTDGPHSLPNALAAVGPVMGGYPSAASTVTGTTVTLGPFGGELSYWVNGTFANGSRLLARIDTTQVDTITETTAGWEQRVIDLQFWGGQTVTVAFDLIVEPGAAGTTQVRLDDIDVIGRYPCSDGDACTSMDRCVLGMCVGTTLVGCQ